MDGHAYIGTSGWHYQHWRRIFYPEGLPAARMLEYYSRHFETVEINNTFYRLPTEQALESWRDTVPPDFRFAVKGSRFITHMKKLREPENAVEVFFTRLSHLGKEIGPILFQLPPYWPVNPERLEHFLSVIPKNHFYVLELREPSWCSSEVYRILRKHNVALCLHDWGGSTWPMELTANFMYIRMHGPGGGYRGDYDESMLHSWASRIRQWLKEVSAIYVYFNNDQGGYAIKNAKTLAAMLAQNCQTPKAA